jgi:hypothetical protein
MAALAIEYPKSIPVRINVIDLLRAYYRSGAAIYTLSFILTICLTLIVIVSRHILAALIAISIFITQLFFHGIMRLMRPRTIMIGFTADAFTILCLLLVLILSLPEGVFGSESFPMIFIFCLGLVILWRLILTDCKRAIGKVKNKNEREFRELKIFE